MIVRISSAPPPISVESKSISLATNQARSAGQIKLGEAGDNRPGTCTAALSGPASTTYSRPGSFKRDRSTSSGRKKAERSSVDRIGEAVSKFDPVTSFGSETVRSNDQPFQIPKKQCSTSTVCSPRISHRDRRRSSPRFPLSGSLPGQGESLLPPASGELSSACH